MAKLQRNGRSAERDPGSVLLLIGIVAVAANLRPAITAVGPLVGRIRTDLELLSGFAGFSTALPLLSLGLCSMFVPWLSRRVGNESTIAMGLAVLVAGIGIRLIPTAAALFVGTFVAGIGIAIGNVTLPALVKARFPQRIGMLTGVYATFMGLFAATASGISVPLSDGLGLGWRGALGFWALPALVTMVLWQPQVRAARDGPGRPGQPLQGPGQPLQGHGQPLQRPGAEHVSASEAAATPETSFRSETLLRLWRSPLAWQVTLFMGLQSLIFYVLVTWLPDLLQAKGMSDSTAGWMLSLVQYVALPPTLFIPALADRMPDQRSIAAAVSVLYAVGLAALFGDSAPWLIFGVVCIGLAVGACIGLALTFIGLRTRNADESADLSGMAQSVGYLLAALGPVAFGFIYDATHSWNVPIAALIALCVVMLLAGLGSGRNAFVESTPERRGGESP